MNAETVQRRFLKLNKLFGRICGIWPDQGSRRKLILRTLSLLLMATSLVTQFAYFVIFRSLDSAVDGLAFYVAVFGTFVKVGNYIVNEIKLKVMITRIFDDWASIKSQEEYNIMSTYARRGVIILMCYAEHTFIPATIFGCAPFGSFIMDIYMPLNETRSRTFVYQAYYWDAEKYYMLKQLHMMFVVYMVCIIFCACDMNYVYAVQHACGLLAVTRYRFGKACENLSAIDDDANARSSDKEKYKQVCHSIRSHQRVVQYLKHIEDCHHTYLFISMGMLILAVSVSMLMVVTCTNPLQKIMHGIFFLAQTFHVFFLSVQGQFVINEFNELYNSIYESMWYNSSPRTQALYILALRSCLSPPLLTAGGIMTLNLRSFAEIIKASVSYYTVMKTT